jgi:ribonuclease-3
MSLSTEHLALVESTLKYRFSNEALLCEAVTHSSIADHRLASNERLEFLGDVWLNAIVCTELYRRFPTYAEGEMTKIKSAVVSRKTCAEVAREFGLDRLLMTGKGIPTRQAMPSSLAAAVFESIVGAMFLDGGYEVTREFVLRTISDKITAIAGTLHQHNYKAMLQQHVQSATNGTPVYELLDEKGPDHSKCFEVCVNVGGRRFESAWGTNKKIAEQKAALMALRELSVIGESEAEAAIEAVNAEPAAFE